MGSSVDLNKLLGNQLIKRYLKTAGKSQYTTQEEMNLELGKTNFIMNSNVRGLMSTQTNLQEYIDVTNKNNIKVITVTEIFNADHSTRDNYLQDYKYISKTRLVNPERGGVGIFTHKALHTAEISLGNLHKEGNLEVIACDIKSINMAIFCIYRPNGHANANTREFLTNLENLLKHIKTIKDIKGRHIIISGDFNLDLMNIDNPLVRDFTDIMVTEGFMPMITIPTRITRTSATCIDGIWSNKPEDISSSLVMEDSYISDHLPNGIGFSVKNKTSYKTIKKRTLTEENKIKFKESMTNVNWDEIYNTEEINEKWKKLINTTQKILDEECPIKEMRIPDTIKTNMAPYMTEGLLESKNKLQKLARKASKSPNTLDQEGKSNLENFSTYKTIYCKTRRIAKRSFYNERFAEVKHNSRNTWELINNLIKNKTSNNDIKEIIQNGESITDPVKISEIFNNFFASVGDTEAKNIPKNDTDPLSYLRGLPPESMFLGPTDKEEILKETKKLNKKKSSGWDGIPSFILLDTLPVMTTVFTHCINDSFQKGIFPDCLKLAHVVPIHKKAERTNPTNYRPVSLLSAFSKVFEKILFNRLYKYMEPKLIDEQFGFRPKHSTSDLMIYLLEHISKLLSTDERCLILFFDLAKAFDTLDHKILLRKLERYGIRGIPLKLIDSYLSNRSQQVLVNGSLSSEKKMMIGVPQGSILGPLLFIIYMNDIILATNIGKLGIYADDTTAIIGSPNKTELIDKSKNMLEDLGKWFSCNKLSLSPTKCKYALIDKKLGTETAKSKLSIYGKPLTEIRSDSDTTMNSFVGYLLSETLNSKEHIKKTQKKIRSGVYALRQNKNLPSFTKRNMYFALIHSHINYASVVTIGANKSEWKPIQRLQEKAMRIITNSNYNCPVEPIYKKLKILKVEDLIQTNSLCYAWKAFHTTLPSAILNMIDKGSERNMTIKVNIYPTQKIRNISPIHHITSTWNKLPLNIRRTPTLKAFQKAYMNFTIDSYQS